MELEVNINNSLVLPPFQTKESSVFEEFTNYLLKLSPAIIARLWRSNGEDNTADTDERGRILDLETENDATENNDGDLMLMSFKNGILAISYEIFKKILTFPQDLFRSPMKIIYNPSRSYDRIKATLIRFEDNGDFNEFDNFSNKMIKIYREKGDFDILAAITIRKAQCFLYRNDLNGASRFARISQKLAEHTRFPPLFHAEAFIAFSSVSRIRNKLGKAEKYLDLAKQCFESGYSVEVFARFHENYGTYLDKFLGTLAKSDERVKELALTSFSKMSEIGSQDSRSRVSDKNRFYAMVKSARVLLDSNSSFGRRERTVTQSSIHQAVECLEVIKRHRLLDDLPRGSKIQFQLVESDLYFRQGKFQDAIALLEKSFDEANVFGFETEEPKITQRIQEIQQLLDKKIDDVVEENSVEAENYNTSFQYDNEVSQRQSGSDIFTSEYL